MSRMSRKEIKRDELVSTLESLTLAAEHHARSLLIAAVAAVVLIAAVIAGVWYSRSQATEAALQFAQLQRVVDAPVVQGAGAPGALSYATPQARAEEILRRADALLTEHPSSRQARWAGYWKAVAQKDLGRHADALATLDPLAQSQEDPLLSGSARMQQAQVNEAQGNLQAAAEAYAGLAASAPARFPAEMALMAQARVLEAQGKGEEAKAIYRRVTQEYPESPYASDAGRRLAPTAG